MTQIPSNRPKRNIFLNSSEVETLTYQYITRDIFSDKILEIDYCCQSENVLIELSRRSLWGRKNWFSKLRKSCLALGNTVFNSKCVCRRIVRFHERGSSRGFLLGFWLRRFHSIIVFAINTKLKKIIAVLAALLFWNRSISILRWKGFLILQNNHGKNRETIYATVISKYKNFESKTS